MANINIIVTFSHPDAISNNISYARIDNTSTPSYVTVTGVTSSPYIIQNVANGQYQINITPVYADGRICQPTSQQTVACTGITSFSAFLSGGNIVVSYNAINTLPYVQVNISYPNGGSFSQQYVNAGTNITITPPAGVYGAFTVSMQPVCDPTSGFVGAATAPAVVTVNPPANSTFTNSTGGTLTSVNLSANSNVSQNIFTQPSLANSGVVNFYLSDGIYSTIVVTIATGTLTNGSLTTGSGTYSGVVTGNVVTFNNVVAQGGIAVVVS